MSLSVWQKLYVCVCVCLCKIKIKINTLTKKTCQYGQFMLKLQQLAELVLRYCPVCTELKWVWYSQVSAGHDVWLCTNSRWGANGWQWHTRTKRIMRKTLADEATFLTNAETWSQQVSLPWPTFVPRELTYLSPKFLLYTATFWLFETPLALA